MNEETIHVFQERSLTRGKVFVLMVPCLIFVIVLILFVTFSSYKTQTAATSSQTSVLGKMSND